MRLVRTTEYQISRPIRCRVSSAFTLVELLVVMVVVLILVSLLSTALNQSKSKARQIGCLNNLHQLQVAWILYTDENRDELPLNRSVPSPNEEIFGRANAANSWVVGSPKQDASVANIQKGTLFPYVTTADVYRCPADGSTLPVQRSVRRTRSYSMSLYMNGDTAGLDPRVKTRLSEIVNPSPDHVFVFVEESEASIWNGSFTVPPRDKSALNSASIWSSTPADYHNQGCNLSFADSHVEYWKWYWPKKTDLFNKNSTANKYELRDLKRLQDCVPKP